MQATVLRMTLGVANQRKIRPKFHKISTELESSDSATPFSDNLLARFKFHGTRSEATAPRSRCSAVSLEEGGGVAVSTGSTAQWGVQLLGHSNPRSPN